MKRLAILFAAVATTFSQVASAADLPRKAPPIPPAPIAPSWTGFYVGGNAGYSWGNSDNDWNFFAPAVVQPATCTTGNFCASGSDSTNINGPFIGVQAGYNWQLTNFLIGVEADIQASAQKGDETFSATFATGQIIGGAPVIGTLTAPYRERLSWFGTARGRLGYFFWNNTMLYATGGFAYGRVGISGTVTSTGIAGNPGCTTPPRWV